MIPRYTQKSFKLITTLSLVALWLVSCTQAITPEESCNFVMNSQQQRVSWKTDQRIQVGLENGFGDTDYISAVESALLIWEERLGYQLFDFVGVIEPDQAGDVDINILRENEWEAEFSAEQAKTLIQWRGDNIYSATIGINAANHQFFVEEAEFRKVDLVALMVHEVGHALGLAHTDDIQSVMFPELASNFDARRIPNDFDLDSVRCEY